jgi:hypothetical protein
LSCRVELADRGGQQWIEPQPIMVVEILVAERQDIHPLPDELAHTVLDQIVLAVIDEQGGEPIEDAGLGLHFAEKQPTAVETDCSAIEFSNDRALAQR